MPSAVSASGPSSTRYRAASNRGLRFSPPWEPEAVVFNPATTELLVVVPFAFHLLQAVQAAPHSISADELERVLAAEWSTAEGLDLRGEIEAVLPQLARAGLLETALP